MEEDYYELLGVSRSATLEEIKKAFKTKARHLHPDKGGDPEQFKKLNEAYAVLSNEEQKANYDQFGKKGVNMDFPFPDFFQMFGGMRQASKEKKSADRVLPLEVTLEEAYIGTKLKFRHKRKIYTGEPMPCSTCKGKGQIIERMSTQMGLFQNIRVCPKCAGIGTSIQENQFQTITEITEVTVHPHSAFGSRVVLQNKADEIPGMITGNIILELTPKPHSQFELVNGFHLLCKLSIHPLEAITQFSREFVLPSGEKQVIGYDGDCPFLSSISQLRRIRKKGMFSTSGEQGDLLIQFSLLDFKHPNSNLLYHSARLPLPPYETDNIPLQVIECIEEKPSSRPMNSHPSPQNPFQPHVQECRPS